MIIKEIQKWIEAEYGGVYYDLETEDEIAARIYTEFLGDYIVHISQKEWCIEVDFEFTTDADKLMFIMQHGV